MTIGIDIRVLTLGKRTGVEEYTLNLLSHLLKQDQGIRYKLFYNALHKQKLLYPWLRLSNTALYDFHYPSKLLFSLSRTIRWPKIDQLIGGVDVFFSPHFFLAPLSAKTKHVLTVHDLSILHFPEFFNFKKRLWHRYLMDIKRQIKNADHIIAISGSTRRDILDVYNIEPSRVSVVYPGLDEKFQMVQSDTHKKNVAMKKYQLPRHFILYFGTLEPRKNIVGIIKAFETLKEKYQNHGAIKKIKLVLAGNPGWLCGSIYRYAKNSRQGSDIHFTGFVHEKDVPALYASAQIFVYPSFFEGFGFPPLEAMACGVPVITSNNSSLPEVVGDAGLMVDPQNPYEITHALYLMLTDAPLRAHFIQKGFARARLFNWDKSIQKILKILVASQ